jgi:hypothetical protein
MPLTRRTLITHAPPAALASALALTRAPWLRADSAPLQSGHVTQLSPAVLAHTQQALGEITARIHLRTATRSDLLRAADSISLFRAHLAEFPAFDIALREMAGKASTSEFDRADLQRRAFEAVWPYDRAAALGDIQIPEDLGPGLLELRAHGLDRGLDSLASALRGLASKLPVFEGATVFNTPIHLLRAQVGGSGPTFCDTSGFYLNLFGGAIGVVALFGCTPEPALFLICPILGLLAGILGLVSFAQWVLC